MFFAGAPRSEAQVSRANEALLLLWATRRCFICDKTEPCGHRERALDLAELAAEGRRINWERAVVSTRSSETYNVRRAVRTGRWAAVTDRLQRAANNFRGAGQ